VCPGSRRASDANMPAPVAVSTSMVTCCGGVYHGGAAFGGGRWMQIIYLIQLAQHLKSLPVQRRIDALDDPVIFRTEVPTTDRPAVQRQSLLYLPFPYFYLPGY
jgi:5-methylcytosine-specific restriction enzyme B